jgi:hypothetical protein
MLAQMQDQRPPRHLHIDRRIRLEAVLPVEHKAQKALIEFARLLHRKMRKTGTAGLKARVIEAFPIGAAFVNEAGEGL